MPRGTILLSPTNHPGLEAAGYVELAKASLGEQWETVTPPPIPESRAEVLSVWTGKELVIWGGSDDIGVWQNGARFEPLTGMWKRLPLFGSLAARKNGSIVWTGEEVLIWGGETDFSVTDGGGRYNPESNHSQRAYARCPSRDGTHNLRRVRCHHFHRPISASLNRSRQPHDDCEQRVRPRRT